MRILLSNDDGYLAPGLKALSEAVKQIAEEVTVIAPDRNRSGASNSLTLYDPLRVYLADNGFYYVNGTPSDCVHLALTGLWDYEPDMVISGINAGANLGDDVIYSGTVAAAMEGRFLGLPAIAVSMASRDPQNFATAGRVVQNLIQRLQHHALPADTILNVNVPDVAWEDLAGWEVTRLGNRHKSEAVIKERDPKNLPIYWIGPAGSEADAGPGTDFHAVNNNCVSITPLSVDLTRYDSINSLREWLKAK
ncbi:MAG: 5'/3'-nucleotidase SurE [Gammaproteobacteria bacterium]|nr:5'/3'-nucleotidase SurE [Gammaproteobacteria bacterium]